MDFNILILSAGRRVELVNCFKRAAIKENIENKIITADASLTAPATYFSDKNYLIPRISEPGYIEKIIEICNLENVKLIVPTIDTELEILARNRNKIETNSDAKVLISDSDVISICRDKINTYNFFKHHGFLVPKLIEEKDLDNENYNLPLFIKPLNGSSSINAFKVNSKEELIFFRKYINKPMVQEFISGDEFTVDVFCDFESNPITIVPRKRLTVRSGEILNGKIKKDRQIIEDVKRLITVLKPIGHITVQCMKTEKGIEYIEINPRFGGGAPMSIMAGADSCGNLYKLLKKETLFYTEDYKEDLTFLRFDQSIFLNNKMEKIND
jgi:carbamoyl-phosphate synthase large subunit